MYICDCGEEFETPEDYQEHQETMARITPHMQQLQTAARQRANAKRAKRKRVSDVLETIMLSLKYAARPEDWNSLRVQMNGRTYLIWADEDAE